MVTIRKAVLLIVLGFALSRGAAAVVIVLPLNGAIGPANADFAVRNLARASQEHAQLFVLQMDTPGGLEASMRDVIKAILASRVPVAAFVAPSGARAASAGTYIVYASHIAAMAPGTNLGAATPVRIGPGDAVPTTPPDGSGNSPDGQGAERRAPTGTSRDPMTAKHVQDAAAYIRGLAQLRGRNAQWAERAVREAVSLSASEALEQHVIDLVARDVPELLAKLDGRAVQTVAGDMRLATRGVAVVMLEPDWRARLLAAITDPGIALILMTIGIYGLLFEFLSPGFVLPGVVGGISLLLGLFALQMLPVNYAGLALILLGIACMVAETFVASFGILGIGGILAFAIGAVMLIDTEVPGFGIPLSLIVGLAVASAIFIFFVSSLVWKARRRPVISGQEQLLSCTGVMLDDADTEGWARVRSERWWVHTRVALKRGQVVRVIGRHGLVLDVVPEPDTR